MEYSVVIPSFNSSKTIGVALQSLVNQTYKNFEVVIVDDASSDYLETLKVINDFKSKLSITVLRNQVNMNGAYSRNQGIKAAKGKYIAFLDADDYWVNQRLENGFKIIKQYADQNIFIYGKFELIRSHQHGAVLPIRAIKKNELVSEYVFASGQNMQTSTFLCPKKVAELIMFDEKLSRHQDTDFAMRAQRLGIKIIFENKKCANYCFNSTDLKQRIRAGRINSEYCESWLKLKKGYFSEVSMAGYNLLVHARIKYLEGEKKSAIIMMIRSLIKLKLSNIIDIIKVKFIIFTQTRFGI